MFAEISTEMRSRMQFLESIDSRDRTDGTERTKRLRQIPRETGRFLALFAANCPAGDFIEIGTSAGYSALWISLAVRDRGVKLTTYEVDPQKVKLARESFAVAGIEDCVDLVEGDFLVRGHDVRGVAFCFIDCEKELYERCFDVVSGGMVSGGLIVADNASNHYRAIKPMIDKASVDNRFDCMTIPIGKGEFVCRRK